MMNCIFAFIYFVFSSLFRGIDYGIMPERTTHMSSQKLVATHTGRVIASVAIESCGYDGFVTAKRNAEAAFQTAVRAARRAANIAADRKGKAAAKARRVFVGSPQAVKARLAAKVRINGKAAVSLSRKAKEVSKKRSLLKAHRASFVTARTALADAITTKSTFFANWSYSALMSNSIDFDARIEAERQALELAKANYNDACIKYTSTVPAPAVEVTTTKGAKKEVGGMNITDKRRSPIVKVVSDYDVEVFDVEKTMPLGWRSDFVNPAKEEAIAFIDAGNGKMKTELVSFDQLCADLLKKTNTHSNLGKALRSIERRMGHLPMSTITMLPGGDGAIKAIFKTNGRDNIGLGFFANAFMLPSLEEEDVILIEANGMPQERIEEAVKAYIVKGYRPLGARMLVRVKDEAGQPTLGAEYVKCVDALLGSMVNVRSYFSLGSAPALNAFEVPEGGLSTEREAGDSKKILWFAGRAEEIFEGLGGTEGGLPISEKAMERIYGDKRPGQPRMVLRLPNGEELKAVLFKGNHAPMAARAFKGESGDWVFKCRGDFSNDQRGKQAWREGYDFVFLEADAPKGNFKDEVKYSTFKEISGLVEGRMSGWLIARANDVQGKSLVSYQVLSLLAQCQGLDNLVNDINALVSASIAGAVNMIHNDLDKLQLDPNHVDNLELLKKHIAASAPNSQRQARKNHLGGGMSMTCGYVHMSRLVPAGVMVCGDEFGLTPGQIKRGQKRNVAMEDACGGKNPILDANQIWVGKTIRLAEIVHLRNALRTDSFGSLPDTSRVALETLFGRDGLSITDPDEMIQYLNWIMAHAPALTRGSVLMNADDVADLAGDDDGDQLWFSFRCEKTLRIFQEIKSQAKGNESYSIETNKGAQLPSATGSRQFADMLTAEGEELWEMVRFIMAPNKGQGLVGYLANLCTVLITFFEKVPNDKGGMKFANIWVERLQAALNLMQQTAIDMQKRIYATLCLLRWTLADLRKSESGHGLVPGYDFPALAHEFEKQGFDPDSFTAEQYRAALMETEMPSIPHHYTGELMSVKTDMDAQYAVGAVGSWLIWECLSLLITDKPAAWCNDIHEDAHGGLNPYEVAESLRQCEEPDVKIFGELTDSVEELVSKLYVEKPSQLYSWKGQAKTRPFGVEAPPAIQVNHDLALAAKASHKPVGAPAYEVSSMLSSLTSEFSVHNMTEVSISRFLNSVLDKFYLEAALANNAKATSEKFQSAEERSGVEALNLLIEGLESFEHDAGIYYKLAQAFAQTLNPRVKVHNKDAKIGLVATLFAWHQTEYNSWSFDKVEELVLSGAEVAGKKLKKTDLWMTHPASPISDYTDEGIKGNAARSAVMGVRSKLRKSQKFLELCEAKLAEHWAAGFDKAKAKATWFIDEGLPAMVKAVERQAIVSSKRDTLRTLKDVATLWHCDEGGRATWSQERTSLEILIAAFCEGNLVWFEPIKEQLKVLAANAKAPDELKQLKKQLREASAEDKADIKRQLSDSRSGVKAKHILAKLEDESIRSCNLLDSVLDPGQNPLAKQTLAGLLDNAGPIVNVERAWQRANEAEREYLQRWTTELGTWVDTRVKDRETGERRTKRRLYANSRVQWDLGEKATVGFVKALLENGVSIYKLTPIPGSSRQSWRLLDAFVNEFQPLSDWQICNGFGHLVSSAIPTGVDNPEADRWKRFNGANLLTEEIEWHNSLNISVMTSSDRDWHDAQLTGLKEELTYLESLESNPMMARWGHLYYPAATWGFQQRTYVGQTTKKKLAGRAWVALSLLGRHNAKYHEQPRYSRIEVDGHVHQVANVTSSLKPLSSNGNNMPWVKAQGDRYASRRKAAMNMSQGRTGHDDTVDLTPFRWDPDEPGVQHSFDDWLSFIEGVACEAQGETSGLVMSTLWFQSHAGRLSVMDPKSQKHDPDIAGKCWKRLQSTPCYEARLHLEALRKGEWVDPRMPKLNAEAAKAFYSVVRRIVDID